MLHTPNPASASPTAATPLTSDAAKVTFESSAKRNCRVKSVCWMTQSALTGSSRKKTGARAVNSGMP